MEMEMWHVLFWAALTVLLIAAEIATVQLVAVWFAAGSLAAFVSSLFGLDFYWQVIVFIAGSVLLLIATRPIVRRIAKGKQIHTNADSVVGQECVVKEEINNLAGTGRVYANGLFWTARNAEGDQVIPEGEVCEVTEIQGVKLLVRKKAE